MTIFVFANPDESQNILVEHLFEELEKDYERYFASSYRDARNLFEKLEGGEGVVAVVSSELYSERGCVCSSDLIREARGRGYRAVIYSSRKPSDLSPELRELVFSGVPYIKRKIEHLHELDYFEKFLEGLED